MRGLGRLVHHPVELEERQAQSLGLFGVQPPPVALAVQVEHDSGPAVALHEVPGFVDSWEAVGVAPEAWRFPELVV